MKTAREALDTELILQGKRDCPLGNPDTENCIGWYDETKPQCKRCDDAVKNCSDFYDTFTAEHVALMEDVIEAAVWLDSPHVASYTVEREWNQRLHSACLQLMGYRYEHGLSAAANPLRGTDE